jgi:uncharacterized protein YkwD
MTTTRAFAAIAATFTLAFAGAAQATARGLPPLREQFQLQNSAQGWTNSMVSNNDFSHGSDFAGRISAAGFNWSNAGENIASGFNTPWAVVRAWMASTDHCHNILDPHYAAVGTGLNRHAVSSVASGPSTWTQDFGLRMGQSAPSGDTGPQSGCPYTI